MRGIKVILIINYFPLHLAGPLTDFIFLNVPTHAYADKYNQRAKKEKKEK